VKLTITPQVTVDGVMQANGGNDEELDPGFTRGGWARGRPDPEAAAAIAEVYLRADAFLFGRRTYELFARYWGVQDDPDSPFVTSLNSRPKHVVSTTLPSAEWAGTSLISDDVEARIRELKAAPGGELVVPGSGVLSRWLLENELVDEIALFVFPVIVGDGARLFPDRGKDFGLELVASRVFPTGIISATYRPTGRPRYA